MYRTHKPKPPTLAHLTYQITSSQAFIQRLEAERNDVAADWERTRLEALQADLARLVNTVTPAEVG